MNSRNSIPPNQHTKPLTARIRSQTREFWEALRNTPEAFRLVWSASRSAALVGVSLMLVAAVLPAAQAWAGKLIIDSIVIAADQGMEPLSGLRYVVPYLALEFALLLIGSMASQIRSLFDRIIQSQLTNHVNSLIIRKAISLDLQFFENPVFYDTLQNARRQADASALTIVNSTLQMVQQVITIISLIVLLLRFSPWLAVIIFLSAIPSFLSNSQFAERAFRAVSRRAPEARLLNYLEQLLTGSDTVKRSSSLGWANHY